MTRGYCCESIQDQQYTGAHRISEVLHCAKYDRPLTLLALGRFKKIYIIIMVALISLSDEGHCDLKTFDTSFNGIRRDNINDFSVIVCLIPRYAQQLSLLTILPRWPRPPAC